MSKEKINLLKETIKSIWCEDDEVKAEHVEQKTEEGMTWRIMVASRPWNVVYV